MFFIVDMGNEPSEHQCVSTIINKLLFPTDEDPGSEQTDAGCSLPNVHGEVRARDRSDRLGDSGGTPEGHHRPPHC